MGAGSGGFHRNTVGLSASPLGASPRTRQPARRLLCVALALAGIGDVHAQSTPLNPNTWLGTTSAWNSASNWSLGVVPTSADSSVIDGTTTAVIDGYAAVDSYAYVGYQSSGSLTIEGGGSLTDTGGVVGDEAGSSGTVTITGTGSIWSAHLLADGVVGSGVITITDGGELLTDVLDLGYLATNTNTLNVSGTGSQLIVSTATVTGPSTINVTAGGTVSQVATTLGEFMSTNVASTVNVSGAGSRWTNTGTMFIGFLEPSTFTAQDGATVVQTVTYVGDYYGANGTVILTGAGTTWTNSGNLYIGVNGGGAGSFSVSDGALATVDDAVILSQSATASTLTIGTGGTLQVGGVNGILGNNVPVQLAGGTLQVYGSALTTNATTPFVLTNTSTIDTGNLGATLAGVLSGSGGLIKTGTADLTLSGANTYSGTTTISAGTLSLSGSGSIAASTDVVANGTLDISGTSNGAAIMSLDGSGNVTLGHQALTLTQANGNFAGVISGTGALTLTGGTEILSGANTYTGGTIISGGTLQGDTTSLPGAITDNAALVFNQASDGTFSNVISGSGSFTKTGAGTLILDSTNTYTGGTTVSAGTLEVGDMNTPAASVDGAVNVQSGGTLRGHGTIDGDVVSDGMVWPGGSIGTLTINGTYTQNADGTLSLDIAPSGASQLLVLGNASLAGTLDLIFAPGTYTNANLILLKANAVSGTFSTINATLPASFTDTLTYTDAAVELALASNPSPPPVRMAPLDGSLFGNLMRAVSVTGQQALTSVLDVALAPCDDSTPSMQNTTTCANGAWAQYTGSNLSLNGAGGLNSTGFGLLGGVDHALGSAHLGIEGGVNQLNGNDTSGGNGRVDSVHAGLYADADTGPIVLSGTLDGMHSDYHLQRATGIGAATSTPDGSMLSAALQAAWPLTFAQWQFTPKVGALYQHQTLDGFSESIASTNELAADFPVTGSRSTYNALQPYVAATLQNGFVAQGITYLPQLSVGYRYDTRNSSPVVNVIAEDGTLFALSGDQQARGLATVGARMTAQAGASWNLYMDYEGLFANRLHDNALSVGFTKHF